MADDNTPGASAGEVRTGEFVDMHRVSIEYSAYFAVQAPASPSDRPPALLVAMHGYGQSCKSFVRNLLPLRDRNVLVLAPQAINHFYWDRGKVGFTWLTRFMRDRTLDHTLVYLHQVMDAVRERYSFDEERVFFLGFSSGAAMAFRLASAGIARPAGVVACSGDLPADVVEKLPGLARFPVLLVHGKDDDIMRIEKSHEAERALRTNGFEFDTQYFEGGHDLPEAEWKRIFDWLLKCAGA